MAPDTFGDREKSQETAYIRDEENRFRLNAEAVRLFGLWAAAQLARGESYPATLSAEFSMHGLEHVMARVLADFRTAQIETTEHHLANQFAVHVAEATKALS